jgi:hypothetical protein
MRPRLTPLLFLLAPILHGEFQLFTVRGTTETPVTGLVDMGSTATGQPLDVLVRVKNAGTTMATIQTLNVQGTGFRLYQAPTPPISLVAGFSLDFYVRFVSDQPVADGRANLRVNNATVTFLASAMAGVNVYAVEEDGTKTPRPAGQSTVFLPIERGQRSTRRFVVENPHSVAVTVNSVTVSGDSFQLVTAIPPPWQLAAGSSNTIEITFQPATSGLKTGALVLDGRAYPLEGVGKEPAFPKPFITIGPEAQQSARQVKVSVNFDTVSRADGAGQLRMEFTPAMAGPDDPAVVFLSNSKRTIPFVVSPGQSQALFSNQKETLFQTGTTAGTLRFVAEMGGYTAETSVTIAAAPVLVDTITVTRGLDLLQMSVKGFDNTRSASDVAFTFFDSAGKMIDPGIIRANVADRFQAYFQTAPLGGMFAMQANFPATGLTNVITGVEIEFRNQAGTLRTPRLTF